MLLIDRHAIPERSHEPADALRLLVLDLISDACDVPPDTVAVLDAEAWRTVLAMVRQHRLGGLLHWQLEHRHSALPVPDEVREEVREAWRHSTRRVLGMQYELVTLGKLLDAAGIAWIALKGPFLAYHAYPEAALRPMRDLDILVPANRLVDAWNVVVGAGAKPAAAGDGEQRLNHALRTNKHHLPALATPSGFSNLELHRGIRSAASTVGRHDGALLLDDLWAHAVNLPIAATPVRFPAPTDMLLHLILHAAYDHLLNNGPLILSDIAFLLRRHTIDWRRFWQTMTTLEAMRGAVLLLDLAARYWRDLPIEWTPAAAGLRGGLDTVRGPAALLLLQDRELTPDIWRKRGTGQPRGAIRRTFGRLFIPRAEMALLYPGAARTPRLLLYYPVRWWQLATRRIPDAWRTGRRVDLRRQAAIDTDVSRWLRV